MYFPAEIKYLIIKHLRKASFLQIRKRVEYILEFPRFVERKDDMDEASNHYTGMFESLGRDIWETSMLRWQYQARSPFWKDFKLPIKYFSSMTLYRKAGPDVAIKRPSSDRFWSSVAADNGLISKTLWEKHRDPYLLTEYILLPQCTSCQRQMYVCEKKESERIRTHTNWHDCHGVLRTHFGEPFLSHERSA